MKLHPAIPEGYGQLSVNHKLHVAGIIAGRELLSGLMDWLETGERLLGSADNRHALNEKREEREIRLQCSVDEYLDNRDLLPERPL